ncbi:hypothetical protein ACA910_010835 [Epithemia clementina (nom. ined.)]
MTITVGIAGGSGAGKTTLVRRLFEALGGNENVCCLNHDSYYRDFPLRPLHEREKANYDHPDSLDTDLMVEHLKSLKAGQGCCVPVYDFTTHARRQETEHVEARRIILVDGILLFTHPELTREMDIKVFVDADADIRLSRRLKRDTSERGRSVEQVLEQYHGTVRPMHMEWVEPSKKEADLIVHSSGHSMDVAVEMIANHLRIKAHVDQRK